MSMLQAQVDELRTMAVSVGLEMPQAATLMMDAADTILSLRDRAQDLQAHNAKLRKERDMYRDLVGMMDHPDLNAQLQAENAKLRELAGALDDCRHTYCGDCVRWDCPNGGCSLDGVLRELGIEVDE